MNTNSTPSTFSQDAAPSNSLEPTIDVLKFTDSGKPGSSFKGTATVEVHKLIPGYVIGFGKISCFDAYEEADPTDKGKCRFLNFKNEQDKWESSVWLRRETGPQEKQDRALTYKLLGRIRQAVDAHLAQQETPDGQLDELPQNVSADDSDIPF